MLIRGLLLLIVIATPLSAQRVVLGAHVAGQEFVLTRDSLPARTSASPGLREHLTWHSAQPGLAWSELSLRAGRLRIAVRAILVRIDPQLYDFDLALLTRTNGMTGAWTVDSVDSDVAFAVNAGQFKETGPWGWLVMQSYERRDPGFGPVSIGLAYDTAHVLRWVSVKDLVRARKDRSIVWAFQTYPLLISDGNVPPLLRHGDEVNRAHRDARLILGQTADGALFFLLTRYDALGAVAGRVPIGLTVPESVLLAGALDFRHAVMLDGGLSAQLLVRDSTGIAQVWRGTRQVPLGLVARPRTNR